MKERMIIISSALIWFCCVETPTTLEELTIEKTFSKLFQSHDFESRVTAIILSSEFKRTKLSQSLLELLPNVEEIEKVAVLYALSRSDSDDYIESFIEAIPVHEKGIRELLDIESSRLSYFSDPQLRILNYLGALAIQNDKAFVKLETIGRYADGWQGESITELLDIAKKCRAENEAIR